MLKNYLKIALRNLDRQKGFSFINIFGLSIGIACCLLIFLYVTDELSYDNHHAKADRIYRVAKERISGGDESKSAWSQVPMGPAIEQNFAEAEEVIRFWNAFEPLLGFDNQYFTESDFYFTDPEVFEVFTFPLIKGSLETVLSQPGSVVLTESAAKKYFGDQDPLGKVISYDGYPGGEIEMTVTGVMEDLPSNSQFRFDFLATTVGVETEQDNWGSHKPIWTYVLLNEGANKVSLEEKLPGYLDAQTSSSAVTNQVRLEPLQSVHLYSEFQGGFKAGGSIIFVYLFSAIGIFILLIACINFVNLSTARSLKRAAEVGVRKTLGAQRSELVKQFLGEAFVITLLALIFGIFLAELALPVMNELAAKDLSLNLADPYLLPALFGLLVFVSLAAGLYPALFLSGFKPVRVLGNKISAETSGGNLRKGLVVFQFAVSIVLIVVTLTVQNQMDYVREKNLGFDKEQVVVLPYTSNADVLMNRFRQNPNITGASISQRVPVNTINTDGRTVNLPDKEEPIRVESYVIDDNFMDTYRLDMVAGRNISDDLASDSSAFIINETAVTEFGWSSPQEALGKSLTWSGYKEGTVIGVVNDFHLASLHEQIEPLVMHTLPSEGSWWKTFISVRLQTDNVAETLSYLESNWKEITPAGAYNYFFIDQSIEQLHQADQRTGQIFSYFAGFAILIACLGLFGLASYMTIKREKEVGIRKVFGANVGNIVVLLSSDFIRLVGIGFIIAAPIAYLAMNSWLQNFAYHTEIGIGIFVVAGLIALAVSLLSVSYQSTKAALMNPIKSIRSE